MGVKANLVSRAKKKSALAKKNWDREPIGSLGRGKVRRAATLSPLFEEPGYWKSYLLHPGHFFLQCPYPGGGLGVRE